MVLTAAGLVAIENIRAGDVVISTNPDTLDTAEKTVLETYVRQVDKLVHLTVNGEKIVTTVDHPFYVQGRGFINAGNLLTGDTLISVNGEDLLVSSCYIEEREHTTVYNFQVEDYHTYFVGECNVWVHNAEYGNGHYNNNPSDNPKVLADAVEDPNAVYGYSPNPKSDRIGQYANNPELGIDWSDPQKVSKYRQRRIEYHRKNDNIDELIIQMQQNGATPEEIGRAANHQRNLNRLNDYINNNDYVGLERVKQSNLKKYGNEFGLTADDALKKYGSWEMVIEKTKSANPGMDTCCGLYDDYIHLYNN